MENYLIILEETKTGYSAYSPDIEGVAAAGATKEEARKLFLEALEFHFEGLREDGIEIPKAHSDVAFSSEDCTGVLNVRTKKSTHLKLVKIAEKENVSVSHLVNDAIVQKYG
jgi:predicted RNase H-like HicB family nuclease